MTGETKPKVAMIGLDAAELSFIQSSLSSLPNLRRVLNSGVLRRLRSTADSMPGSVWPTFYTGTPPGAHGVYHHLQWDSEAMRLRRVAADWLYCEPFWYELERQGREVIAIDVPMTFPPRLKRGIEITNWGSHDQLGSFATHPRDLGREIRRRFGKHPMGYEIPVKKSHGEIQRIRANLIKGAQRKGELSRWLLSTHEWDFFITVFGECHRGGHILWPGDGTQDATIRSTALLDVYQAEDQAIGQILDSLRLDETEVIVFSLHGMGPNISQEHFMPKIMDQVNRRFRRFDRNTSVSLAPQRQRSVMRLLREKLPARLQNAIGQAVPVSVRDMVVNRAITTGHDWQHTLGVALLADLNGYLRFNVHGREKQGVLEPGSESFTKYVEWMTECFYNLRIAESGEPLVKDIRFANNEFTGNRCSYLPDAIVTWTDAGPASRVHSETIGTLTAELATGRAGNHRPDGFCIVLDPGVEQGVEAPPWHILDLAPMIFQKTIRTSLPL